MSKIRINELARELEVKPNVILELLPELGVTDKKTHSSSLEDEADLEAGRTTGSMSTVLNDASRYYRQVSAAVWRAEVFLTRPSRSQHRATSPYVNPKLASPSPRLLW